MRTYKDNVNSITFAGRGIPKDEGNCDYQEFLALLAAGEAELEQTLEETKVARCAEVDALRDVHLRAGFAFERAGRHVLQTRGEDDRLNWLGVLSGCQALVMGGQGTSSLLIRTEGNDTLSIPAAELMAILLGALNHQSAICAAAWSHKDAINAITEESGGREAVQAHDITTGWPE